ncbi:transcriptional regulator, LysR family [Kaistia soli DSM 19436]|uniref:Transcriptional regulator, LysR family n=1 Tax=Kaistia soli DSM 19436 TaxID=1122133 RepID=A0A1M4Z442_9HYPH|nr:LysR family transcriptional regulator [Kaistia soli]SHF12811.1 transcriptional regulator, LysR family [Kaistia soli DSM 19436]
MKTDLGDLSAVLAVARSGGFRGAAKTLGASPSGVSEAVRRVEDGLGMRLFHRTTRSVVPTEAGRRLLERLHPALVEVEAALDAVNSLRDRPAGPLRLNVPFSASRLVLPSIVAPFLAAYPDIRLDIVAEDAYVDLVAVGCDAGIRYDERLPQDMIAVPIGPRRQRFACAASPAYLDQYGRPSHPQDLLTHRCITARMASGAQHDWEFERDGKIEQIRVSGPLVIQPGAAFDLAIESAARGLGVVAIFEDWLRPYFESGALEPVLEDWWQEFSGPFLYYPGRRLVPAPLRVFIDFIKTAALMEAG